IGSYPFALATQRGNEASANIDHATYQLLNEDRGRPQGRAWQGMATAIRQGVLLFVWDDVGASSLAVRLPPLGGFVDILVRADIAAALVAALTPVGGSIRFVSSNYSGWREVRRIRLADLTRVDFRSVPSLASVRCLQETLAPQTTNLRG